ncbi:(2Fe-2S)-binding protein [Jatrophihabitans cynanchi]|uniref:(2Fe-2S)-binding protein n=1 Tax=Jatrophihabitans cynanchi TaxID=2944128 RepID=A0ABY7K1T7_9ACTN|nr:(2Fe-2S)-binding protein [Jatrophihabitans sp. SB3-54]WAX58473.1 (2Fe-2S)-binding protein [Jatrophihabitans sp. SB3-54]
MGDRVEVELVVNGVRRRATVEARKTLADFLRDDCRLTGTHLGCEHGVCGACTVLLDGAAVRSCLVFAVQASEREVQTIEGIAAEDGSFHPLQEAMSECNAFQCGFCTPGFLMTALEFLRDNPDPSQAEIRAGMSGNLCRCTGYGSILDGVHLAAAKLRDGARGQS